MTGHTKAILYTYWEQHIERKPGWINHSYYQSKERARFQSVFKEAYTVAYHPGVVYRNSLWLSEEDDEEAIRLFKEEEMKKIKEFQHKIDLHVEKLKLLEQGDLIYDAV